MLYLTTVYRLLFPEKNDYRKDDHIVDCPHLIEKRLCKTRIVDFHREKLATSEILLSYFQEMVDSIVFQ